MFCPRRFTPFVRHLDLLARSLFERACAARDLRVAELGEDATAADLTTVTAADIDAVVGGLTGEHGGFGGGSNGFASGHDLGL